MGNKFNALRRQPNHSCVGFHRDTQLHPPCLLADTRERAVDPKTGEEKIAIYSICNDTENQLSERNVAQRNINWCTTTANPTKAQVHSATTSRSRLAALLCSSSKQASTCSASPAKFPSASLFTTTVARATLSDRGICAAILERAASRERSGLRFRSRESWTSGELGRDFSQPSTQFHII